MASGTPPRRRRGATPPRATLPLIPVLIAVIVIGFGIGAALSLLGRKQPAAVAVATPTPTLAPLATERPPSTPQPATPKPQTPKPATPKPATPKPAATHATAPVETPATAAAATVAPETPPPATTAPTVAPTHAPAAPPRPQTVVQRTPPPVAPPRVVPPPATAPPTEPPPPPPDAVDSDLARLSAGVVRAYLAALARGDSAAAYASFGAEPGDARVKLSERTFADPSMRVSHLEAKTSASGDRVTVNVDLETPSGAYFAQYFLHRTPTGAAVIDNHSFIKP